MTRPLLLATGVLFLALAWMIRLPPEVCGPFGQHMVVHVAVVAVAAPLIAFGLAGGRADPTLRWPALAAPLPAMLLELAVVWGWHLPAPQEAAQASSPVYLVEQASFLAVGLLLWLSVFGGGAEARARSGVGVIALLLTSMHMTLLGALIALAPRALYGYALLPDQQAAGLVMLLGGATSYLAGGLYLTQRMLREPDRAPLG